MLNRLPNHTPSLSEMLDDIGSPKAREVAEKLGVSERTVRRWLTGKTPRSVLLCVWWLSREGDSAWHCEINGQQGSPSPVFAWQGTPTSAAAPRPEPRR